MYQKRIYIYNRQHSEHNIIIVLCTSVTSLTVFRSYVDGVLVEAGFRTYQRFIHSYTTHSQSQTAHNWRIELCVCVFRTAYAVLHSGMAYLYTLSIAHTNVVNVCVRLQWTNYMAISDFAAFTPIILSLIWMKFGSDFITDRIEVIFSNNFLLFFYRIFLAEQNSISQSESLISIASPGRIAKWIYWFSFSLQWDLSN